MSKLFNLESVPAFRVATPKALANAVEGAPSSHYRRRIQRQLRRENRAY